MRRRIRFVVQGQVQGVGFRPFVFNLAEEYGLTGFVRNSPRGVVIEAQGKPASLEGFAAVFKSRLPPLARVTAFEREDCALVPGENAFAIAPSTAGSSHAVLVSPDIAICDDCLADIADSANRRYLYPFTNCTNCGPRYSIIRSIPYDRAGTSMGCFPLCPDCREEYENPRDRRFHAQPNACPVCGPEVALIRKQPAGEPGAASSPFPDRSPFSFSTLPKGAGKQEDAGDGALRGLDGTLRERPEYGDAAMRGLARLLLDGGIAAIKGLGGFHLACHACDAAAVALLRKRKHRPHKPFAVMAADLEQARAVALISDEEESLLVSPAQPIVICALRPSALAPGISPDTATVGLMLPYTPLHGVLFRHLKHMETAGRPLVLVMTSGNPGGEPICLGNREAVQSLASMADAFLLHNRDIFTRVDDSVLRPMPGHPPLRYRRARGYAPRPVSLPRLDPLARNGKDPRGGACGGTPAPCILGVGPELKNTLCFTKGDDAFVSQHIGDMSTLATAAFHEEVRDRLAALLRVRPVAVVSDLHPDYLSSAMAEEWAQKRGLPVLRLQHHFAHAHAVLAEHAFSGKALVLALDGTGLGEDGDLWGGEALYVDCSPGTVRQKKQPEHKRLACFAPMDLPGGEAAIREPWRIAHALLLRLHLLPDGQHATASACGKPPVRLPWLPEHAQAALHLPAMLARRINSPVSTSCGRLFDAVSALLGLCSVTTHEGQAAIRMEEAQAPDEGAEPLYPCPFSLPGGPGSDLLQLDTHTLFRAVYADWAKGEDVPRIARRFHAALAAGLVALAKHLAAQWDVRHVGLSGGCMQNVTLCRALVRGLEEQGLIPLLHKELPPNDGCVSLGQAAWGRYAVWGGAR